MIRRRPTKKGIVQFAVFNLGGISFFVIGYAAFAVLYGLLHWQWLLAKMLADFLGWSTNFVIQYFWAFGAEVKTHAHPDKIKLKFTAVSLMNLGIDYGIVALLAWIGVTPFIGLIIAANFFTVWKWLMYKHYVFRPKSTHRTD